jgi:hypothetical protein
VSDRILSLLTKLLACLVCGVNDRIEAVNRPLLLHFEQCCGLFPGLIENLTGLFLSLVDNGRRSRGHLVNHLPDLLLCAAGSLARLLSHR